MWKILIAQIREEIFIAVCFQKNKKGYHQRTRGTGDLQCIVKYILNESETRRKNVQDIR